MQRKKAVLLSKVALSVTLPTPQGISFGPSLPFSPAGRQAKTFCPNSGTVLKNPDLNVICTFIRILIIFSNTSVKFMFVRVEIKIEFNELSIGTSLAIHEMITLAPGL